jgi:hypothetical protein
MSAVSDGHAESLLVGIVETPSVQARYSQPSMRSAYDT